MSVFGTPFFAPNPFLNPVFGSMNPNQFAAYSQDVGQLLFNFSGQPLPIRTWPQTNPFIFFPGLTGAGGFMGIG